MTLNEVYGILSHCNPGPIPIMVSRHPDPQVTPPGPPLPPRPTLAGLPWEQEVLNMQTLTEFEPSVYSNKFLQQKSYDKLLDTEALGISSGGPHGCYRP